MKVFVLTLALLGLVVAAPGVAADDGLPCGDMGAKNCVLHLYDEVFECNPLYNYFQECDPAPDS